MSEDKKEGAAGLTTGFTTVAEIRRREDHHEGIYSEKKLLIPTLILIAAGIIGLVISLL